MVCWLTTAVCTAYTRSFDAFDINVPGEPKKNPPYDFCWYYSNAWEFLYEILHDC